MRFQPDFHPQHTRDLRFHRFGVSRARGTLHGFRRRRSDSNFPRGRPARAPRLGTAALDINFSSPVSQRDSVGVGPDNVPPSTSSLEPILRSNTGDLSSQASLAQLQTASGRAKANRDPSTVTLCTVVLPAPPRQSSTSQARPPFLVPSNSISSRNIYIKPPPLDPLSLQSIVVSTPRPPSRRRLQISSRRATPFWTPGSLAPHREACPYPLFGPRRDHPFGHRRG